MPTFFCNNCRQNKDTTELASTVPVYQSDPIRTCQPCYDWYHNPPKEKKVEKWFFCVSCRAEVVSVRYRKRISIIMPNELDLVHGKTYDFCSFCTRKFREYNEAEDRNLEENPYEVWE